MIRRGAGSYRHPERCWRGECKHHQVELVAVADGFEMRCEGAGCTGTWYGRTADEAWDARVTNPGGR